MTRPVVYLIGGSPGAGKTTLGRAFGARLGIDSFTGSDITSGVRAIVTPESHPDVHRIGRGGPVAYFTDTTVESLVEDSLATNRAVWPALERVIENRMRWGPSVVIDAWEFIPSLVATLELGSIRPLWLDVAHEVLESRERSVEGFYAASHDPERMVENFLGRSTWWNDWVRTEAERYGLTVLRQDGSRSVDDLGDEVLARLG